MAQQPSMILDMLKTPQQVREEQLAKLRQDSAAQAQLLGAPVQATTALPGLLSRFAAGEALEQRVDLNKAARRASGAVGSALKMAGYDEAAKAATQAFVSPEERLASNRQEILKGLDQSNPQELALAAKKLQSMGDTQGANALVTRAQELEKNAAQTALVREQARTELSKRLKNMAAANKSDAERAQLISESGLRLSKLETEILLNETRATKTSAETDRLNAILPFEIDEKIANIVFTELRGGKTEAETTKILAEAGVDLELKQAELLVKQANAELKRAETDRLYALLPLDVQEKLGQISLDAANTKKTLEETTTEIARRLPELANLDADTQSKLANRLATDALTRKRDVETGAIEAKLPGELAIQQANITKSEAQTAELKSRIDLNQKKLADLGLTDFMRELNASGLSNEEKDKLIRQRVKTRARTGDVTAEDLKLKSQLDRYTAEIAKGEQAFRGLKTAEMAIRILPDATVGPATEARAYVNKLLVSTGLGGDQLQANADAFLQVITGKLTLEGAQQLKGTFSDRDIQFIQAQQPSAGWTYQTLEKAFNDLYIKNYIDYNRAKAFENNLGTYNEEEFRSLKILDLSEQYENLYKAQGLENLQLIRQQVNAARQAAQQQ